MEMTVFVAALGNCNSLDCRRSQAANTIEWASGHDHGRGVRGALQVYCLRLQSVLIPLPPMAFGITIKLLMRPYLMLLQSLTGILPRRFAQTFLAPLLLLPDKLPRQLQEQVQRKLLVCNFDLNKYGH